MSLKFFEEINANDKAGGKGASLAKMYKNGFMVPNGFVILADEFIKFLIENNVKTKIDELIESCFSKTEKEISEISEKIISILDKCVISDEIKYNIISRFEKLNCKYVAVRSSATSEDGKNSAWAGQLETFLNVDKTNIMESVKKCWLSIFSPRAIFYRIKNNDRKEIAVAVVVQKMVQSNVSGIAFSVNPTNSEYNEIVVEAVLGLGEAIVSGKVSPDTYIVNKEKMQIINKQIRNQKEKLVENKWIKEENGNIQKLDDKKVLDLSNEIIKIEDYYGFPVDVEWGIENDNFYILQCRPITTVNNKLITMINKIKSAGNWNFYVARKFNWFVENTEILSTIEKNQIDLLGFELVIQNYLCLNGDEYSLDSDFKILCKKLEGYFQNDICFFEKFAKVEFDLVDRIKNYLEKLKNSNFSKLTLKELATEVKEFNNVYVDSFIPGMTRPEDYLMEKLNKELDQNKFSKDNIDFIFSKVCTCPNYYPLSYSQEPLDLLKIALEDQKGNNIEELLNKHIEEYAWIKGPVEFEDTSFTKDDFLERLNGLKNTNIKEKIDNILSVRKNNDIEYEDVLKRFSFTEKQLKLIKAIRDFIFLRTYTTEYSDHLFYVARHTLFKEIVKRTGIADLDLIMLDDKEIINILKNDGKMNSQIKEMLENRKLGFAMIWIDGKVQTVFGKDSINIQNQIAEVFKKASDEVETKNNNKKVIPGSVANKGKVRGIARVLTSYEDIYNVQKGDIIVATMTTPDFVSAMEKASGFITDEGGITCHAAILSREFNVPCIVGTVNGTKEIKDGDEIELDAFEGKVYIL